MKLDSSIAAIVTGGASGLGEATARMLRREGVKVALFDMNRERGEAVAREIGAAFCEANVADEQSVDRALAVPTAGRDAESEMRLYAARAFGGATRRLRSFG